MKILRIGMEYWSNSIDLEQTAPLEQSDQGLHCLLFASIYLYFFVLKSVVNLYEDKVYHITLVNVS